CEPALPESELERRLGATPERAAAVCRALERLDELRLVVRVHGRVLALAVPGEAPALCDARDFPGGTVDLPRPTIAVMQRARAHLDALLARESADGARGTTAARTPAATLAAAGPEGA